MKIEIITDRKPFVHGKPTEMGDIVEVSDDEARFMIGNGFALAAKAPKRARKDNGQLQADDPSTHDVNEAWEGGKAPKKRGRPKKNV